MWVGVTIAIVAMAVVADFVVRKYCDAKLAVLYDSGDADALIEFLKVPPATYAYSLYNRTYVMTHAYRLKGDFDGAEHSFDVLLRFETPASARHKLCVNAFEFFIEAERYGRAKEMLDEIETLDSERVGSYDACKRLYDIVACGKTRYIDELKDELAVLDSAACGRETAVARMQALFLLSKSYENTGDLELADKYAKLSAETFAAV